MRNDVLALEKVFVGIFLREKWGGVRERERERERLSGCSTYLCIHWLILVCVLTRD